MKTSYKEFLAHIISEICYYATENEVKPNDMLLSIADNIRTLLEISDFNKWEGRLN